MFGVNHLVADHFIIKRRRHAVRIGGKVKRDFACLGKVNCDFQIRHVGKRANRALVSRLEQQGRRLRPTKFVKGDLRIIEIHSQTSFMRPR